MKGIFQKLTIIFCSYLFIGICFAIPPSEVWRADLRSPDVIFKQGFSAWGSNDDIVQHIIGESCLAQNTAFISTTSNQDFAINWVRGLLQRSAVGFCYYIYEIRATDNFYNSVETLNELVGSPHVPNAVDLPAALIVARDEFEYSAVSRIEPYQIRGVTTYYRDASGNIVTNHQDNPNYIARDTTANPEPYTSSDHLPPENLSHPLVTGEPSTTACFLSPQQLDQHPHFEPFLLHNFWLDN